MISVQLIQSISLAEVSRPTQTTETTNHTTTKPDLTLHISLAAAIGLLTLCLAFSVCKMRNSCKKSGTLQYWDVLLVLMSVLNACVPHYCTVLNSTYVFPVKLILVILAFYTQFNALITASVTSYYSFIDRMDFIFSAAD